MFNSDNFVKILGELPVHDSSQELLLFQQDF